MWLVVNYSAIDCAIRVICGPKAADLAYREYSMGWWPGTRHIDEVFAATAWKYIVDLGPSRGIKETVSGGMLENRRRYARVPIAGAGDLHSRFPNDAWRELEPQPWGNAAGSE